MISRRNLLQASLATTLIAPTAQPQPINPELPNNAALLSYYQRLSGSLDDRLVIWWMRGTRYGVVDAQPTALYGMEVGMFHRWYPQPDGSFKAAFFELTYYTDPQTGELLHQFVNPYTDATNRVRHVRLGPEIRVLTESGLASPDNPLVAKFNSTLGPASVNGEWIWIPSSVEATIRFPKPTAPEILVNIYTTVQGRLQDALNEELISAPCSLEFHNVLKWEPWMEMGAHSGHMMTTASGRKLESMHELPPSYLEMAAEVHGKYIANPATLLEELAAKNGLI